LKLLSYSYLYIVTNVAWSDLAERRRKRIDHFSPCGLCAARVIRPLRVHFMGQGKLGASPRRNDFDDHETLVLRGAGDAPREDQSPRSVNHAIFPNMIDLFALTDESFVIIEIVPSGT